MAPFMGNELLQGEHVYLAFPEKEEGATITHWAQDIAFQRMLRRGLVYPTGNGDDFSEWFHGMIDKETGYPFAVRRRDDDLLVGFIVVNDIFWQARHAVVILAIDPAQQGRGYGTDALRALLKYCFLEMNLNRLGLDVLAYNEGARRVYEKAGFRVEGTKRSFAYRDGVYYDMHIMGILRSDWEALYGYPPITLGTPTTPPATA